MEWLFVAAIIVLAGYVIYLKFFNRNSNEEDSKSFPEIRDDRPLPYRKKYLLTKNEWKFYQDLKGVADRHHLHILCKIRMADIVEPVSTEDRSEWSRNFSKIRSKHIDFVLAQPENLRIMLLIELDDGSHKRPEVMRRDAFVEKVYRDVGYPLLRVTNAVGLEEKIVGALGISCTDGTTVNS